MDVTPEMRQAVYEQDCQEHGHNYDFNNILTFKVAPNARATHTADIVVTHEDKLPHVYCTRCGDVWLVMPVAFGDYETAEGQLYQRLKVDSDLATLITRLRGKRQADGQA